MHRLSFSKFTVALLISTLVLATACAGPTGAQGAQGPEGMAGPPGVGNGASITIMSVTGTTAANVTGSVAAGKPIIVIGSGFTPGDVANVVVVGAGIEGMGYPFTDYIPDYYLGSASVLKNGSFATVPGKSFTNLSSDNMAGVPPTREIAKLGYLGMGSANLTAVLHTVKATDGAGVVATCPLLITK